MRGMLKAVMAMRRIRRSSIGQMSSEEGAAVARKGSVGGPAMFDAGPDRGRRASLGAIGPGPMPSARGGSGTLGVYAGFRGGCRHGSKGLRHA